MTKYILFIFFACSLIGVFCEAVIETEELQQQIIEHGLECHYAPGSNQGNGYHFMDIAAVIDTNKIVDYEPSFQTATFESAEGIPVDSLDLFEIKGGVYPVLAELTVEDDHERNQHIMYCKLKGISSSGKSG